MSKPNDRKVNGRLSREAGFFRSPWAEETRRTKRNLLLGSIAGLAVSAAGIMPKEISAFGLKVEDIDQTAFLVLLSLIIGYLLITFIFSVYSDFMHSYWSELNSIETTAQKVEITGPESTDQRSKEISVFTNTLDRIRLVQKLKNVHMVRILIDVAIPVIVGITSVSWLIWKLYRMN